MAIEEWVQRSIEAPLTRRSRRTLGKLEKEGVSPLHLVEVLADRLDDRLSYHEARLGDSDRVTINTVGLKELRQLLFLLIGQVHEWKNITLPKTQANILASNALGGLLDYKVLYEASQDKYKTLVKLMAMTKTLLSEQQVNTLLEELDEGMRNYLSKKST